eukprot:3303519-Amphidinium_carterae.1
MGSRASNVIAMTKHQIERGTALLWSQAASFTVPQAFTQTHMQSRTRQSRLADTLAAYGLVGQPSASRRCIRQRHCGSDTPHLSNTNAMACLGIACSTGNMFEGRM